MVWPGNLYNSTVVGHQARNFQRHSERIETTPKVAENSLKVNHFWETAIDLLILDFDPKMWHQPIPIWIHCDHLWSKTFHLDVPVRLPPCTATTIACMHQDLDISGAMEKVGPATQQWPNIGININKHRFRYCEIIPQHILINAIFVPSRIERCLKISISVVYLSSGNHQPKNVRILRHCDLAKSVKTIINDCSIFAIATGSDEDRQRLSSHN